jgi:signal transduction histidine kinase
MVCLVHIAEVNKELKKYDDALNYYKQSLLLSEQVKDLKFSATNYSGIGQVYSLQGKSELAITEMKKSISIAERINDKEIMALGYTVIAHMYVDLREFNEAVKYIGKATAINEANGKKDELSQNYKDLAKCYYSINDVNNAYKNILLHSELNDMLLNKEIAKKNTEMDAKYQSEKKEKEIVSLTKDNVIKGLEIKKQTLLKNSFIGGLALLLVLSFFIYNNFRIGNKLRLQNIRNRIASDLHDDVGSTLNSISVYSEVAKQKSPTVVDELEQIGDASRKIIEVMSDIVWTINPKNDTFENIILRMSTLAYNLLKAKNIEHTFRADESLNETKLSLESRRNFYLIFKEALNNLVKYSDATRASITLTNENGLIKLAVRDNGIGFDVAQTSKGNGLLNMKARAKEINAQLKIESEKGNGTNVELILKA